MIDTIPSWPGERVVDLDHVIKPTYDLSAPATDILNELFGSNEWTQVGEQLDDYDNSFNVARFNTVDQVIINLSAEFTGAAGVEAQLNMEMALWAELAGAGTVEAVLVRDILLAAEMTGAGEVNSTMIRERMLSAILTGAGTIAAEVFKTHVDSIGFDGEFKPGDRIEINADKLKMLLNGQNALHLMQGDFFDLNAGTNTLTYIDDKNGTVRIRITHKDKFAGG